jgi:hypothetical protein
MMFPQFCGRKSLCYCARLNMTVSVLSSTIVQIRAYRRIKKREMERK